MHPVVLHHGILNALTLKLGRFRCNYFGGGIDAAIARRGHPLIISRVHPTAGVAARAGQLKEQIIRGLDRMGNTQRIILIAHSMGGVDARHMISRLGMAERVAALVTISTPHRGNAYADWCRRHLGQRLGGFNMAAAIRLDVGSINDLTIDNCRRFNDCTPDAPGVRYFSISAARPWNKVPLFAIHPWRVIQKVEGANDGLVSIRSAQWGTHLGTWPVDHWGQLNKRYVLGRTEIRDVTPLYLKLLDTVGAALR